MGERTDADRLVEIRRWVRSLPEEQRRRAWRRASLSYSAESTALAEGAHIERDEMVWPDGERYPRQAEPCPGEQYVFGLSSSERIPLVFAEGLRVSATYLLERIEQSGMSAAVHAAFVREVVTWARRARPRVRFLGSRHVRSVPQKKHPCSWYVNPFLLDGDGRCGVVENTVLVPFRRKSDGVEGKDWQCPEHRGLTNSRWTCLLPDEEMSPLGLAYRRVDSLPEDRREAAMFRLVVSLHAAEQAVTMMGARIEGGEVVWPNGERYPSFSVERVRVVGSDPR